MTSAAGGSSHAGPYRRGVATLLIVAVAALAGPSGCGNAGPTGSHRRPLDLPADARVLHWFQDNTLLVATAGTLWFVDSDVGEKIREFPSPDPSLEFHDARCLTEEVGILVFRPPAVSREPDRDARLSYRFTDWQDAARHEFLDPAVRWAGTNTLDCSLFQFSAEREKTLLVNGKERKQDTSFPKLLPASRGVTEVYEVGWRRPTRTDRGSREYAVTLRGQDGHHAGRRVTLELPFHHGSAASRYDRQNDRYLWYAPTQRGFSAQPEEWQLLTWRVSPDMALQETVALPAGPWVYRESFLKGLSCFSCGCSCYEHMDARFEGDALFLMVYGRAVREEHQGLYRYDLSAAGDGAWTPVVLGSVDRGYAVAPDGCGVVYRQHEQFFIADTCSGA
jgi:hypothetical protein